MSLIAEKEALYKEYCGKVRRYIFGKLQNKDDAEDLVSETFLKVYEKYDTFDGELASVSTWIYSITRNTVIDYFRTRRVHSELADNLCGEENADDEIIRAESIEKLGKALMKLDKRSREIVILRYYKGMTLKDIAARIGISYAYIKILHGSALGILRKHLNG